MGNKRKLVVLVVLSMLMTPRVAASATEREVGTTTDGCVQSVPDPGTTSPVSICYTLYKPTGAGPTHRVPMVLNAPAWGLDRTSDPRRFDRWLRAGFGVLMFDQRGFGDSGGTAYFQNPDVEGQDVERLVDLVASLDWVKLEAPGDPFLGAIGISYGGGFQLNGAFTEIRDRGATRFDALAPQITWWDVKNSLGPMGAVRTQWMSALLANGGDALPVSVQQAFAYGSSTGRWSRGGVGEGADLDPFFMRNGAAWHASQGRRLDIPVLLHQGMNDTLFNANQAVHTFDSALTAAARSRSMVVGYFGGHNRPNVYPKGTGGPGSDPCAAALSGDYETLELRFFQEELLGMSTGLGGRGQVHLASGTTTCRTMGTTMTNTSIPVGSLSSGPLGGTTVRVLNGPVSVGGAASLTGSVSTGASDARAFFALSVGVTAVTARVVQNQVLPLREPVPVSGAPRTIELPLVAVDVPAGQALFLQMLPLSDMFGHGSDPPALISLINGTLRLRVL